MLSIAACRPSSEANGRRHHTASATQDECSYTEPNMETKVDSSIRFTSGIAYLVSNMFNNRLSVTKRQQTKWLVTCFRCGGKQCANKKQELESRIYEVYRSNARKPQPQMDADKRRLAERSRMDSAISSVGGCAVVYKVRPICRVQCFASASPRS